MPLELFLRASFFSHKRDNKPLIREFSADEFFAGLREENPQPCTLISCLRKQKVGDQDGCPHKNGLAWSPVVFEGTRANKNASLVEGPLALDLDHVTDAQIDQALAAVEGYRFFLHTTHSHRAVDQCLRLYLVPSRPILPEEWPRFWRALVRQFAPFCDESAKDPARLYFLPSAPSDAYSSATPDRAWFEEGEGRAVDVDSLLGTLTDSRQLLDEITRESQALGLYDDLEVLKDALLAARLSYARQKFKEAALKQETCTRLINGTSLADLGARDTTVNRIASILAFQLPRGTSVDGALALVGPSLAAMPLEEGETRDQWEEIFRKKWDRAVERRAEQDAAAEAVRQAIRAGFTGLNSAIEAKTSTDKEDWRKSLIWVKPETLKSGGFNISLILRNSEETKEAFRFNLLSKEVEIHCGLFKGHDLDTLSTALCDWLEQVWGLSVSKTEVEDRILLIARENAYDPLAAYLTSLKWDGIPRVDRFLFDYIKCATKDTLGRDCTEYLKMIGSRFLISAVARGLRGGCKVDTVLAIEGDQGLGKSTAFTILGGAWFCDTQLHIGDKDSRILAAKTWVIELAEGAALKDSETRAQKAFITAVSDYLRPAYGRVHLKFERRCVFVITINETDYLLDRTGNRRYWPAFALDIDVQAIARDRDQIWAEAVHRFLTNEKWWLDKAEQRIAESQAELRVSEGRTANTTDRILEWFCRMPKKPEYVTTHQVATEVFGYVAKDVGRGVEMDMGEALRKLGFEKGQKWISGRGIKIFVPPKDLAGNVPKNNPVSN